MSKNKYIKQLKEIVNDKTSGSTEMLLNLLNILQNFMKQNQNPIILKSVLEEIITKQSLFINLTTVTKKIIDNLTNEETINQIVSSTLLYYEMLYENQANNIIQQIHKKEITVFTHSNSSSIKKITENIYKNLKITEIYQTISFPGYEGKVQADYFANLGIKTFLINDTNVAEFIKQSDLVLLGSDAYNQNYFVNKVGSYNICLIAKHFLKPVFVLSDKNKYKENIERLFEIQKTSKNQYIVNGILEKIPRNLCKILF